MSKYICHANGNPKSFIAWAIMDGDWPMINACEYAHYEIFRTKTEALDSIGGGDIDTKIKKIEIFFKRK